jgi:Tfp pilus assembly PilM family ATPase
MVSASVRLTNSWRKLEEMGFKNETLVNTQELGRAIKRHRDELKMSLRDVVLAGSVKDTLIAS